MYKHLQFVAATLTAGMLLGSGTADANSADRFWGGIAGVMLGSGLTSLYYHERSDRREGRLRYLSHRGYPVRYRGERYHASRRRAAPRSSCDTTAYRYHPSKKVKPQRRKPLPKSKKRVPLPAISLLERLNTAQKIQKALLGLGLYHGKLDGELHSYQTEQALEKFYQRYGSEEREGSDRQIRKRLLTLGELFLFDQALIARSHTATAQIMQIQTALKIHGFYHGRIDGIMGKQTRAAIAGYKKKRYLEESPYLDLESKYHLVTSAKRKNRQAIERILAKPGQKERPYIGSRLLPYPRAQSM